MITATIVDDEPTDARTLATSAERYCPDVKVLDICYSAASALKSINEQKPQLLFLDIEMPHMNGFELLEKLPDIDFELVFTTSYDQYAIKAFRLVRWITC
jgi:two-component system LytT family response regulator